MAIINGRPAHFHSASTAQLTPESQPAHAKIIPSDAPRVRFAWASPESALLMPFAFDIARYRRQRSSGGVVRNGIRTVWTLLDQPGIGMTFSHLATVIKVASQRDPGFEVRPDRDRKTNAQPLTARPSVGRLTVAIVSELRGRRLAERYHT